MRREQLDLGAAGHEAFGRVEHLGTVRAVRGDHGDPDERAAVQVEVTRLRRAHLEAPAQLRDDRAHHGPLLLQRVDVPEQEVQLGTAEVREVFKVPKIGNVAGSLVRSGTIVRNSKARLVRDGVVVADNLTIDSLRRFKDDVRDVTEGYECGIGLGNFNDVKVEDVIETFEMREKPRG